MEEIITITCLECGEDFEIHIDDESTACPNCDCFMWVDCKDDGTCELTLIKEE